ncbi:MAG TPA: response regulator, partial [Pirellulaceae bacterium]|nr:response regulator [Pirellulaceae bacterium]
LVLSRKENEKVLFPHLGIAVQILRLGGGKARLGIEAPGDVSVVRHEIASEEQLAEFTDRLKQSAKSGTHEVRNRLHTTLLGLCLIQKQLSRNLVEDAEETLVRLVANMQGLDSELGKTHRDSHASSRRKALVVEDNSNERRLLAGYLSLSGFEVDSVDDGVKALDYLASHARPDAVVLDMQLPRLGGAAAVGVLRSDPRFHGLKVYAVSGMDRGALRVPVGPEGVDYWFTKPLDPQLLVERINAEAQPAVA